MQPGVCTESLALEVAHARRAPPHILRRAAELLGHITPYSQLGVEARGHEDGRTAPGSAPAAAVEQLAASDPQQAAVQHALASCAAERHAAVVLVKPRARLPAPAAGAAYLYALRWRSGSVWSCGVTHDLPAVRKAASRRRSGVAAFMYVDAGECDESADASGATLAQCLADAGIPLV